MDEQGNTAGWMLESHSLVMAETYKNWMDNDIGYVLSALRPSYCWA